MNKKHSRILNALSLEMARLIVLFLMPEFAYLLTQGFNEILVLTDTPKFKY